MNTLNSLALPIIQAPMAGGATSAQLVSSVCQAGALGSFACGILSPQAMQTGVSAIRQLTDLPFAMNLFVLPHIQTPDAKAVEAVKTWLEPYLHDLGLGFPTPLQWCESFEAQFETLLQLKPAVASFAFGLLTTEQVHALHERNIEVVGTANSVQQMQQWFANGADAVVVQGTEAGGHQGGAEEIPEALRLGTAALLQQCRAHTEKHLIAAGGIMNAQDVAKLLALGANAVQVGTAFLCCEESGLSAEMKQALWDKRQQNTQLTKLFSGKLARGISVKLMQDLAEYEHQTLPYPYQNALTSPLRAWANQQHQWQYLSLWAGSGVAHMRQQSAAEILKHLSV